MRRGTFRMLLASLSLLALAAAAVAQTKSPPIWSRLTKARCVVVGQVTAIEDKTVAATSTPASKEQQTFHIAAIKVGEVVLGAKGQETIKVGFTKADLLKAEQEACFILTPHFEKPFFMLQDPALDLFATDHRYFELRMRILKMAAQCLEKPSEALQSQEPRVRLLAAALLISRYRDADVGGKTEPIDAKESKLLLRVLRDADWGREDKSFRLSPQPLFALLGLKEKDGWNPPKEEAAVRLAAENWLIDNHSAYRILRFVAEDRK